MDCSRRRPILSIAWCRRFLGDKSMGRRIDHRLARAAAVFAALGAASCEPGSIYRGIPPRSAARQPPPPDYYPPPREEYPPPPEPQARAPLDRPLREEDLPAPRPSPRQEETPRTPPPSSAL